MTTKSAFLVLKKECSEAVQWLSNHLELSGLHVMQTFDLNATRLDHSLCSCPHHGTEQCDCQMVVLLVYESKYPPASVVAHGHDGQTWFTLVDSPQQRVDPHFEAVIQDTLAPYIFALKLEDLAYAA